MNTWLVGYICAIPMAWYLLYHMFNAYGHRHMPSIYRGALSRISRLQDLKAGLVFAIFWPITLWVVGGVLLLLHREKTK